MLIHWLRLFQIKSEIAIINHEVVIREIVKKTKITTNIKNSQVHDLASLI